RHAVRAGEYAVEDVGHATVRVTREAADAVSRGVSDSWITTQVKTRYGLDRDLEARKIHVSTRSGVVELSGRVDSEDAALKAIRDALDTKGVVAVDSQLSYPTTRQA